MSSTELPPSPPSAGFRGSPSFQRLKRGFTTDPDSDEPRATSKRALVTTVDQGFSSLSNFVVGVAVARIAGPVGLGGFTLAYACWLVLAALHRSLVTDPMAIENDARSSDADSRLRLGFASEVILAVTAAICLLIVGIPLYLFGQHTFGESLLAVVPWLPFLLVQDYWRWTGFMRRKPGKALANDSVYNIVQATCFAIVAVMHVHNVVLIIGSWGLGAVAGAFFGLWQFKTRPNFKGGFSALRARWHMSKWLAANSVSGWAASQASVLLAGFILGPAGLGALRAAQALVTGPALVLIQAGGSVGLPEASRALADRGWLGLRKVAIVVSAAGMLSIGAVGVAVVFFGGPLLRITYGADFSKYWGASELFAVAFLVQSMALGYILILKTTRNTRSLFQVQLIALLISVAAVSILANTNGVTGAAAAAIVSGVANMIGLAYFGRKSHKELLAAENKVSQGPGGPLGMDQITNNDQTIAAEFR